MDSYKYVIVGNSAGGLAAARETGKTDTSNSLLIISEEGYPAYSRPLIAKHLSDGKSIEMMQLVPRGFYESQGIDLRLSTRAVRIDVAANALHLHDGTTITWNQLLLATGGQPIVPPYLDGTSKASSRLLRTTTHRQSHAACPQCDMWSSWVQDSLASVRQMRCASVAWA